MIALLGALALMILGGVAALARRTGAANAVARGACVAGCGAGLVAVALALAGLLPAQVRLPWAVPGGSFWLAIDPLSALFLAPLFVVAALGAIYGGPYLAHLAHADSSAPRSLGSHWFFYNALVCSMALVLTARNGVLFLFAWEVMALTSYFLVIFEGDRPEVAAAGRLYLVATHLGTALLFVLFQMLGTTGAGAETAIAGSGAPLAAGALRSLDFVPRAHAGGAWAGWIFILALLGFGAKAGIVPCHVWLPEAHPAAPSHVSALMSGVMIKTGIYGMLRVWTLAGLPPAWGGWLLLGLGLIGGFYGIVMALGQGDIKRLLAYSSIENIGIILIGLGLGVLGASAGLPALAALGFGGALLHTINHAVFKSLLFFGAGIVAHACGTRRIDRLGGLLKALPWTGGAFLVGSIAICALPPCNGFFGEFLLYGAAFRAVRAADPALAGAGLVAVSGLALLGGLALATFAKAFGIAFLGEPRAALPSPPKEPPRAMLLVPVLLAVACLALGPGAPWLGPLVRPVVAQIAGWPSPMAFPDASPLGTSPSGASPTVAAAPAAASAWIPAGAAYGAGALVVLFSLLIVLRAKLLRGRSIRAAGTWDCGYGAPDARMQYTAASFADPLRGQLWPLARAEQTLHAPRGVFPRAASWLQATLEPWLDWGWRPLLWRMIWVFGLLRRLQGGSLHLYILYIAATLLIVLIWKLS